MRFLPAFFLLTACSSAKVLPASAATEAERACARALDDLRADKDAGVPCSVAKARVRALEPLCPLDYVCGTALDGGAE